MFDLVATCSEYILANLIAINVMHHSFSVEVSELHRERLERVALRHMIFDARLEFFVGKGNSSDSLEFVVGQG